MALILGENAYIELADFKAWCDLRAYDYSGYTNAQIEAAIVVSSSDYIDVTYDFKGEPESSSQQMQLPTSEVAIADIEKGAAQAAWQQLTGLLFVEQSTSSGEIKRERKKLDVMEVETEYQDSSAATYTYSTTTISRLLAPYLAGGGGGLPAYRA